MKPTYTFDYLFSADNKALRGIRISSIEEWAKEEEADEEKGNFNYYKPKTKWQKLVEKWDNFVYRIFKV